MAAIAEHTRQSVERNLDKFLAKKNIYISRYKMAVNKAEKKFKRGALAHVGRSIE